MKMRKPPSQAMALTIEQVDEIRDAVRGWRQGPGFVGPPPGGQLERIIEVILGTSARPTTYLQYGAPTRHRAAYARPGGCDLAP
ncbi:MAG: hypothetical protein M3445_02185 [Actinomycetota bacterium]|nr:hypothetical protein [Actinomycetota bacterium]